MRWVEELLAILSLFVAVLEAQAHTYLASSEALDHIVSLGLGSLRVNDIHIETIVNQLMKQLLGSLNALHKHQHGRSEALEWSNI